MKNKGLIFAFEGVNGSGKTSTMALVAKELRLKGYDILTTCEPTTNSFGLKIRELLFKSGEISSLAEFFLFLADRAENIEKVINPALEEGKIVLCDRFIFSTVIFNIFKDMNEKKEELLKELKQQAFFLSYYYFNIDKLRNIIFNIGPKYEELNNMLRQDYLIIAENFNSFVINTKIDQEQVVKQVVEYIESEVKNARIN